MRAALIPVGEEPRIIEMENTLQEMQAAVGGNIEVFDVLFEGKPCLYVNEEGIYECKPNRAVYATKDMEEAGYLSQMHPNEVVKEGELYTILFGNILAVSYDVDEEGELVERDITDEEFEKVKKVFVDRESGMREVINIQLHSQGHL